MNLIRRAFALTAATMIPTLVTAAACAGGDATTAPGIRRWVVGASFARPYPLLAWPFVVLRRRHLATGGPQ